jgi:hypothetical protein
MQTRQMSRMNGTAQKIQKLALARMRGPNQEDAFDTKTVTLVVFVQLAVDCFRLAALGEKAALGFRQAATIHTYAVRVTLTDDPQRDESDTKQPLRHSGD